MDNLIRITDIARERTERQLLEEVKGMDAIQREEYLSSIAHIIDAMLNEKVADGAYYREGADCKDYLGTDSGFEKD